MGDPHLLSTSGIIGAARFDMELARGAMVGEYEIETVLGAGGMGQVYAIVHPVIGKRAAAKVLHPDLSRDRDAVQRFVQEARAVNKIGHPNIVDIFGFGSLADGRSYFVMERLVGESLRERVRRGRLGVGSACSILDTLALTLAAAHANGIVHRDLKPDNVFLARTATGTAPTVKLLDFGIAKLLVSEGPSAPMTKAGSMLGTPAYISPEQARGAAIDHRTDVYSLGAMAYELLTGALVFPSKTALEMVTKHIADTPPSVRTLTPGVPAELDELIQRMLAKTPEQRPTLDEARERFRAYATSPDAYTPSADSAPVNLPITTELSYATGTIVDAPTVRAAVSSPVVTEAPSRRGLGVVLACCAGVAIGIAVFVATRGPRIPLAPPPHEARQSEPDPALAAPAPAPPPAAGPATPPDVPPPAPPERTWTTTRTWASSQPLAPPPPPVDVTPASTPIAAPAPAPAPPSEATVTSAPPLVQKRVHAHTPKRPATQAPPVDLDRPR